MDNPSANSILKYLKQKYFIINLDTFKIIESNNPNVTIGGHCYKEIFQLNEPCHQYGKKCICNQISGNKEEIALYHVQDDYKLGFTVFNISKLPDEDGTINHLLVQEIDGRDERSSHSIYYLPENENAIAILSPNGKILYANEQVSLNLTNTKQFVIGTNLADYITAAQMDRMQLMLTKVIEKQKTLEQKLAVHFIHKLRWLSNRMEPIFFGPFMEPAILAISHDITDQILSKNIRLQSDLNFKMITENISDVIWKLDIQILYFTYMSPSIYQLRGITVKEALKESLAESMHPDDYLAIKKVLEKYRHGQNTSILREVNHVFEIRQYHKDGTLIWVEVTITILKNEEGEFVEILGISRDVTAKRNKKAGLIKSLEKEKFYADIIRDSSQAVCIGYPDGRAEALNNATYELFGYTKQEVASLNWRTDLTPQKWWEQEQLILEHAVSHKQAITYEKEFFHKDGHVIPVRLLVHPKFNDKGEFQFFIAHITDLSEINKAKKQLKENEDRLKYAQLAGNDGLWDWDIASGNLYMSPRYLEILGYDHDEIPQHYSIFEELIHPKDLKRVMETHEKYLNNETPRFESQFRMKHKDGHYVPILSRSYKILDKSGNAVRLVGTHIDLTEIHIVQQQLKASQERFKLLSDLTLEGILIHDNGITLDANKALLNMLECSLDDVLGKNVIDMYSTDKARPIYYENVKNNTTKTYQAEIKSAGGRVIPVDVTGSLTRIGHNKVRVTSIRDISQRLEAEKAIGKLSAVVEQSANSVIITNTKGEIEYVNNMFIQLSGYSIKDVLGKTPGFLKSGNIHPSVYKGLWDTISKGEVWTGELQNKAKNGQLFWIESTISPIKDSDGVITNYVGINVDVTQKKQDRQKLDDLSKRLRLAVSAANFGVWDVNLDTREVYWDEKMHEIYGLPISENKSKYDHFRKVIDKKDWKKFKQDTTGGYVEDELYEIELKIYPHGKLKYIKNFLMFSSSNSVKKYRRLVGITYDITKQKEAEQELIREKEKAKENDELKSAFLANMSHEIRTPLNGIIGFTDLLRDEELEASHEEKENFLNVIYNNGQILLHLVNDIIDLSKIETGQLSVNLRVLSLESIVEKVVVVFDQQITDKGLEFKYPKKYNSINAIADITRIHQIFTNLLGNAIKFTKKGFIEIGFQEREKDVLLWVKDTGVGISKKAQKVIFDRFSQGRPVRDQLLGGTGLGLSITKGLVKLLGGEIWVESVENQETCFYFTLPKEDKLNK